MGKYDDIIGLPHHVSDHHPPMPLADRAAQFAPFAALTGYGDSIRETGRLTRKRSCLDEEQKKELDRSLEKLLQDPGRRVRLTYFCPDLRKEGGEYRELEEKFKRVDPVERLLLLEDGSKIPLDDITAIEGL